MSENDAVLNAFSEWWALYGSRIADARNGGTVEPEAFAAGAEWQRERDAQVVEQFATGTIKHSVFGVAIKAACDILAREIREGGHA